ncbi:hypothetical protein QQ045_014728 [Rhodiola kirilowii]
MSPGCCFLTVKKVRLRRWSVRLSLLSISLSFDIWVLTNNSLLSKSFINVFLIFWFILFNLGVVMGLEKPDLENILKTKYYMTCPQRATYILCFFSSLVYFIGLGCEEDAISCNKDIENIIGFSLGPVLLLGILIVYIFRRCRHSKSVTEKLMEDNFFEATKPLLVAKDRR